MAPLSELTFVLTRQDLVSHTSTPTQSLGKARGWLARTYEFLGSMLIIGGFIYYIVLRNIGSSTSGLVIGGIVGLFVFWGLGRVTSIGGGAKSIAKPPPHEDLSYFVGEHRLALYSEYLDVTTPFRFMRLHWDFATPVREGSNIIIYHCGHDRTVIPARVFASTQHADAFFTLLESTAARGKRSNAQHVRDYLAELDYLCQGCDYNLHGCETESCPECGRLLKIADMVPPTK
jgi:hypothetical protein